MKQLPLKRLFVWVLLLVPLPLAGQQDTTRGQLLAVAVHPSGRLYMGDAACRPCHESIYDQFAATAHRNTSRLASPESIAGPLQKPDNTLRSGTVNFTLEEKEDGVYQTAHVLAGGAVHSHSERIDLVVGSNRKGQTYLHWEGNRLYQMPLSYFTPSEKWVYSPGITPGKAAFRRPVGTKCLECHATFFAAASADTGNTFDRGNHLLGVACERCHGPGGRHVAWHQAEPDEPSKYIIDPADLTPDRQLDLCALCHSGPRADKQPTFSFFPGDSLGAYSTPLADQAGDLDVHGNQYGLLAQSPCFIQSDTMTCSTCHDPHRQERTDTALFSQRCAACHQSVESCGMAGQLGDSLRDRCIDCHMPERPSQILQVNTGQADTPVLVRTHRIGIYRDLPDSAQP
ncbi:MAG: hypothetical protein GKR89_31720 [Candidatus Latescibacteria bacterium]|nr:hypothetical protein [Candidatus Latescibacterota bacterium]